MHAPQDHSGRETATVPLSVDNAQSLSETSSLNSKHVRRMSSIADHRAQKAYAVSKREANAAAVCLPTSFCGHLESGNTFTRAACHYASFSEQCRVSTLNCTGTWSFLPGREIKCSQCWSDAVSFHLKINRTQVSYLHARMYCPVSALFSMIALLQSSREQGIDTSNQNSRYIPWTGQDDHPHLAKLEGNAVSTAKYDRYFITFIPKFLFEMFSRVAYVYFLFQV